MSDDILHQTFAFGSPDHQRSHIDKVVAAGILVPRLVSGTPAAVGVRILRFDQGSRADLIRPTELPGMRQRAPM